MALPKIASPSPAIFTSDPLEQIYAKHVMSRDNTAGLAYSFLAQAQDDRASDQDKYLGSLGESNRMANALARHEEAMKLRTEKMHAVTKLAPEGYDPATMSGGEDVFPGGGGTAVAKMLQDLIASKAFANRQKGAGGGTKDSTTVQSVVMPWKDAAGNWVQGPTTITGKAATPQQATGNVDVARQKMAGAIMADPNITKEQKAQMLNTLSRQRSVEE